MSEAAITHDHGRGAHCFEVSGELSVRTARRLFEQTPKFAGETMRIDLAAVREADSAGLALLVHWSNLAESSRVKLEFTGAPPQLREMAKITGLEGLLRA